MTERITPYNYAEIRERYVSHRQLLREFGQKREDLEVALLLASNRQEVSEVALASQPYVSIVNSWNGFAHEYRTLKPMIEPARRFVHALKEKCQLLGLGEIKLPNSSAAYPTLWELSKQYNIPIFPEQGAGHVEYVRAKREAEESPIKGPVKTPKPGSKLGEYMRSLGVPIPKAPVIEQPQKKEDAHAEPQISMPQSDVSLATLLRYYKGKGLVGEEKLAILQTLGAIRKRSFGIESLSGSGKSFSIEMLISLLPQNAVYRMELSSKTADFYSADEINGAKIIYIPELQKAMNSNNPLVVELLKNITEGKAAVRRVRNQGEEKVDVYTIKGDKGVIFTLAVENLFKYDIEFARRVFILHTDISVEQTDAILRTKAARRHQRGLEDEVLSPVDEAALRAHIESCLSLEGLTFENPFVDYLTEFIPRTIRSRSYGDYYFDLVEASATFHHSQRLRQGNTLLVELGDVYNVHELYWHQFCKSLLGIPLIGEEVLREFNGEPMSAGAIHKRLSAGNPAISHGVVSGTIERLLTAGLLEKSGPNLYVKTGDMSVFDKQVDWQEAWNLGLGFMRENYPDITENWSSKQAQDGRIVVEHPITKEVRTLATLGKDSGEGA